MSTRSGRTSRAIVAVVVLYVPLVGALPANPGTITDIASMTGLLAEEPDEDAALAPDGGHPLQPRTASLGVLAEIDELIADEPALARELEAARAAILAAATEPTGGLALALEESARAVGELEGLLTRGLSEDGRARLAGMLDVLTGVARRASLRLVDRAEHAGVARDLVARGRQSIQAGDDALALFEYGQAFDAYDDNLGFVDQMHFDVTTFEQNIVNGVNAKVVGYAYAIAIDGQTFPEWQGAGGSARTAADEPQTAHDPTKEQFLASVSKTITAIAALKLMQEEGIGILESIVDYLPPDWDPHQSIEQLRFIDLLTHRSGFPPKSLNAYDGLKARIEAGVVGPPNGSFNYENANFAMFRVLIPHIWPLGKPIIDALTQLGFEIDLATALAYEFYVRSEIFWPMGIDGACSSMDAVPTLLYLFPDYGTANGWEEPSNLLGCGGFGWNLSAVELAALLAHQRYDDSLLSPQTRFFMNGLFLGWMDPANGYDHPDGDFGTYHMHAGDWSRGNPPIGEAHACIASYPNDGVQASLVINSRLNLGTGYSQCDLMRDAYDNAWIAS